MEMVKIDTLANLLQINGNKEAEDRGLFELVENGYENNMKEMYGLVVIGQVDGGDFEFVTAESDETFKIYKKVGMSVWMRGRLYDSDDVMAYKKEDGSLWVVFEEDKEWCC